MAIESMTGYSEASAGGFKVEIRSVNHRFLELYFKMPPFLIPYEHKMKKLIREFFQRGKLEVYISFTENAKLKINVNRAFVEAIIKTMKSLKEEFQLDAPLGLDYLYWFRDYVFQQDVEFEEALLLELLTEALRKLKKTRQEEGIRLKRFLVEGINNVNEITKAIQAAVEPVTDRYKRLKQRIEQLSLELDETRLYQEAALLADRADITEEVQRIHSHIEEFHKTLNGNENAIGKRLDFILQECLREFNTIQAKSNQIDIVHMAIVAKNEIEKLREQVQNIQ